MSIAACPLCGNPQTVQQTVKDRFRACDPAGEAFEVSLRKPIWTCPRCRMSWEGPEVLTAKEEAYQQALHERQSAVRG